MPRFRSHFKCVEIVSESSIHKNLRGQYGANFFLIEHVRSPLIQSQPQNEYIERWQKEHGKRYEKAFPPKMSVVLTLLPSFDHEERVRKRTARESHKVSKDSQNLTGLRAKLYLYTHKPEGETIISIPLLTGLRRYQKTRRNEKIQMKKRIKQTEQSDVKSASAQEPSTPLPQYLLDRNNPQNAKALSSAIKNKRSEKAAKYSVPLPKVRGISEEEMFKAIGTGKKTKKKSWKRMITKPTFGMSRSESKTYGMDILIVRTVGPDFTRRPIKYERFIRPMGLRYKKAHVTHPELKVTVQLPIISVKKVSLDPISTLLSSIKPDSSSYHPRIPAHLTSHRTPKIQCTHNLVS